MAKGHNFVNDIYTSDRTGPKGVFPTTCREVTRSDTWFLTRYRLFFVRFIAINDDFDTSDPNSINNDFAGIKNWFNEFYARDTSRKIRAVNKAKGERGVPLTTNAPYGYVKDPENPKHWIIDPEAAKIVKYIFDLCMEGRGSSQIANVLREKGILTPTAYKRSTTEPPITVKLREPSSIALCTGSARTSAVHTSSVSLF